MKNIDSFRISNGTIDTVGGKQEWYDDKWQQAAGCGPTCGTNILLYLMKNHSSCKNLCSCKTGSRFEYHEFQKIMWEFITPTQYGVNNVDILTSGIEYYAKTQGVLIKSRAFRVPPRFGRHNVQNDLSQFICEALMNDVPVAFLNYSSGLERRIESWHWVTVVSTTKDLIHTGIIDDGELHTINLKLWLASSMYGGAFASIYPTN